MHDEALITLDDETAVPLRAWAADWPEFQEVGRLAGPRPVYLVGGAVRDLLLGRAPKDADLVLAGPIDGLARRLARALDAARVPLHDDPPTERLVLAGGRTLDLAAYRGPDLIADLRARDFTANALALDLGALLGAGALAIVDPTGGMADLRRGIVRVTGPAALTADPLRLLRAYRLQAATGWRLATTTATLIRRHRRRLRRPARERVAAELLTILASQRAWWALRAMTRDGVLVMALPPLAGPLPPTWPALRRLGRARRDLAALVGRERAALLAQALAAPLAADRPRVALLGWLALALDAAQRRTNLAGATLLDTTTALVRALAVSLRAGRRETGEALAIARALAGSDLLALSATAGATRERLAGLGEAVPGALLLAWALQPVNATRAVQLRALLDLYWQVVAPILAAPPLVDGAALIAALELRPGPALGRLLAAVRGAQVRGEITTPNQALALARALRNDPDWEARPSLPQQAARDPRGPAGHGT